MGRGENRYSPWRVAMAAALVGAWVGAMIALSPETASASCATGEYHSDSQPDFSAHYGAKVANPGMRVSNASATQCDRVSSIGISQNGDNFVEVGWYDVEAGVSNCNGTNGSDTVLVYADVNGFIKCKPGTATPADGNYPTSVQNPDGDTNWDYYWNGSYQGFYSTLITNGAMVANGERHSTGSDQSAYSVFDGLLYQSSGGAWTSWGQVYFTTQNDPDYHDCAVANNWVTVQKGAC